jgi:hypothetical protein
MAYGDDLDGILVDAERASSREGLFSISPEGVELTNILLLDALKALVVIGKILDERR